MKFFLDQEFIEGFRKPLFGRKRHFIDLISIGLVAGNGKQYSALSSDFDYDKANSWVRDNVLQPLYIETVNEDMRSGEFGSHFIPIHQFHQIYGKSRELIAEEIKEFVAMNNDGHPPVFYGYYSDYDWVLFCSLFGTMMDLPKGFPMYCRDLKNMLDQRAERIMEVTELSYERALERIQRHVAYPVCAKEHDALADAQFAKDLYDFLQKL